MGLVQQFLKSFRQEDDLVPGLFQKNDGTVWLRNPDESETQIGAGGAGFTGWTQDAADPANVSSNGGELDLGAGTLAQMFGGSTYALHQIQGSKLDLPLWFIEASSVLQSGLLSLFAIFDDDTFSTILSWSVSFGAGPGGELIITDTDGVGATIAQGQYSSFTGGLWAILGGPDPGVVLNASLGPGIAGLVWAIDPTGAEVLVALPSAPADAAVPTSQRFQWFDDTIGAPKLWIKERDAAGTLYTRIAATLNPDGAYVTVQATPPAGAYQTPLVLDTTPTTGGCYAWDGSAYQQISAALS